MSFALGFILGFLVAYVAPMIRACRGGTAPEPDEETLRRQRQAAREYRNFMTYDGYDRQDDQ